MSWTKKIIDFAVVRADADDKKTTSNAPYSYGRWLHLILDSRNLSPDLLQKITLTYSQARLLYNACNASIQINRANLAMAEDLDEELAPAFSALHFPTEGLFVRLDACSPKDGAQKVPGKASLHSAAEIILRLVTSGRCRTALEDCLNASIPVELFFLPFDKRMASESEFRVFCRPEDCRITGISQYCWHKRWRHACFSGDEQDRIIEQVVLEAQKLRAQILADVKGKDKTDKLIMEQGMSFDILYDEQAHGVELVELNPFGIRSPCGSCLFQWIRDREVLYDERDKRTIEYRVSW
ncbi:hypothetical protein LX32DRAFT_678464 [Colletotrichum zoysiae]|uniref:Cell division cycle protein 123 n=1 Tax=Colletotrichum zoysiae TaxID=1216348 RepID=A0AAD9M7T7_9PEZI|nr:hypothetical protein LX32DRAFT_678464 [Colletotrichum zoysiae]